MECLQYLISENPDFISAIGVLNLVINGMPSIP